MKALKLPSFQYEIWQGSHLFQLQPRLGSIQVVPRPLRLEHSISANSGSTPVLGRFYQLLQRSLGLPIVYSRGSPSSPFGQFCLLVRDQAPLMLGEQFTCLLGRANLAAPWFSSCPYSPFVSKLCEVLSSILPKNGSGNEERLVGKSSKETSTESLPYVLDLTFKGHQFQ